MGWCWKPLRRSAGCIGMLLLSFLAGCASVTGEYAPAPAKLPISDYTYIIGAGDTVNIIVWRNPELSMSVPVRPDGKVAAPLVEEIVAQGKTSTQLARDVEAQLSKYVRDPVVTVLVTGFVGIWPGDAAMSVAMVFIGSALLGRWGLRHAGGTRLSS